MKDSNAVHTIAIELQYKKEKQLFKKDIFQNL